MSKVWHDWWDFFNPPFVSSVCDPFLKKYVYLHDWTDGKGCWEYFCLANRIAIPTQ
jgi:hypothetical protein